MTYSSSPTAKLYQENPAYSKPSLHKPKGWTDTVLGYQNEANQWALCLLRNRKAMRRPYTWAVHLNLNEHVPVEAISPMWAKVKRKLNDRGIVAFWTIEVNRLNKLHFHLIVKNEISEADLKKAIDESMPPRSEMKWRKRVEPIKNEWRLCHYVVKAKVRGRNKQGIELNDLYGKKRLLFHPKMPFKKCGTIGDFWESGKSKKKVWDEIKAIEKKIGEGLEDHRVQRIIKHVRELVGDDVPTRRIERSFGYFANEKNIKAWLDSINDEGRY